MDHPLALRHDLTLAAPARRRFRDAFLNRTFGVFFVVSLLTMFGLSVVYSASAAFAATSEHRARARQAARLEAARAPVPADEPAGPAAADAADADAPTGPGEDARLSSASAADALVLDTPSFHSASFLKKQAVGMVLGFLALFFCYAVDYQAWRRWAPFLFVVAILLLLMVWLPGFGVRVKGAARWVNFRVMTVQPSEVAKLALVLMLARSITLHQRQVRSFRRGLVPHSALVGLVAALVLKEPDLGATACLGVIALTMFYVGGVRSVHLALLISLALAVVAVELTVPYRRARLLAFLDPEAYAQSHAWQLQQALIALGSGGVSGTGLGAGPQKYLFLSEAYNDFIFAIIGEELGIIGALTLSFLFLTLVMMGWKTACTAPDLHGALTAAGITAMFGVSAGIHMFVNTGLMPTKGLNLPFISYGSSSLIVNLAAAGILMNVSRAAEIHWASLPAAPPPEDDDLRPARPGGARIVVRRAGARREVSMDEPPPVA